MGFEYGHHKLDTTTKRLNAKMNEHSDIRTVRLFASNNPIV